MAGDSEIIRRRLESVVVIRTADGIGSGFYVADSGLIVTSKHVVDPGTEVQLRRFDRSTCKARVVRTSPTFDLALVLDAEAGKRQPLPLGDPAAVESGHNVFTIGHPLGLEFTVTRGIVSSRRRIDGTDYLQTDATIHPGSSGGPVLDSHGRVLGVATFKLRVDGLGFAISVRHVHDLLGEVVVKGASQISCPGCRARNNRSRRSCRRCGAALHPVASPVGVDAADTLDLGPLQAALRELDPAAVDLAVAWPTARFSWCGRRAWITLVTGPQPSATVAVRLDAPSGGQDDRWLRQALQANLGGATGRIALDATGLCACATVPAAAADAALLQRTLRELIELAEAVERRLDAEGDGAP